MNKTILSLYIIFILLTASFVVASSSSGSGGTYDDSETSSGSSRSDTYFGNLKCYDTGQLTFQQKPAIKPVIVEKEDGTKLTISGEL